MYAQLSYPLAHSYVGEGTGVYHQPILAHYDAYYLGATTTTINVPAFICGRPPPVAGWNSAVGK